MRRTRRSLSRNITRGRRHLRRRGLGATIVRAGELSGDVVCGTDTYNWLVLEPGADRPRPTLPDGLALERGALVDFPRLEAFDDLREEIETRLEAGGELWLVSDAGAVVFSCWLYPRRAPMRAARGGWLALPEGVVCIEHVRTAPSYRGRGIAPAVYGQLADTQALRGTRAIVMIVRTWNDAALRAAAKGGFRQIATMVYRRRGPLRRVRLMPSRPTELAEQLAARIER